MSSGSSEVTSLGQLRDHHQFDGYVVAEFYSEKGLGRITPALDAALKATGPLTENKFKFVQINAEKHQDIAVAHGVTKLPTFVVYRQGDVVKKLSGTNLPAMLAEFNSLLKNPTDQRSTAEGSRTGESSAAGNGSGTNWLGAELPRGYRDVTDQVEHRRVELLNVDSDKGAVRVLFSTDAPSALSSGKGKDVVDWVESDTDEQLLLYMPFQSVLKLHTIQITSVPPTGDDFDEDETPMRPKTIRLYTNRPKNIGFDEAESTAATQDIEIPESAWNSKGTANIPLRFVKFQNINSLVIFVVDGHGSSEKVRLDRLRLIGESGEKREMGKLEKIGDEAGE